MITVITVIEDKTSWLLLGFNYLFRGYYWKHKRYRKCSCVFKLKWVIALKRSVRFHFIIECPLGLHCYFRWRNESLLRWMHIDISFQQGHIWANTVILKDARCFSTAYCRFCSYISHLKLSILRSLLFKQHSYPWNCMTSTEFYEISDDYRS